MLYSDLIGTGDQMKTSRSVYKKLREIKYKYLVKLYKTYLKKVPENCKYNYPYIVSAGHKNSVIRLCLLHQPDTQGLTSGVYPHLLDVCLLPQHCTNCNGFICRYTKESIQEIFKEEIKSKKYPEIDALEWVLEKTDNGLESIGFIQKLIYYIKALFKK